MQHRSSDLIVKLELRDATNVTGTIHIQISTIVDRQLKHNRMTDSKIKKIIKYL